MMRVRLINALIICESANNLYYNFISFTVVLAAGERGLTTEKEMCGKPYSEPVGGNGL